MHIVRRFQLALLPLSLAVFLGGQGTAGAASFGYFIGCSGGNLLPIVLPPGTTQMYVVLTGASGAGDDLETSALGGGSRVDAIISVNPQTDKFFVEVGRGRVRGAGNNRWPWLWQRR